MGLYSVSKIFLSAASAALALAISEISKKKWKDGCIYALISSLLYLIGYFILFCAYQSEINGHA